MTGFLHGWALIMGVLGLSIPFVVHWLTRPKPQSMPLSTIRFVQSAFEERRRRSRLRDIIVLLLRSVAVGCIALAFARPLLVTDSSRTEVGSSGAARRVVILDVSQSMAASDSGVDGFQNARVQASRYLKPTTGLVANLIIAGATPQPVFESPSTNMKVLQDALGKAVARPERLDAQAAINRAAPMVNGNASGEFDVKSELVIVSDFQRSNWATIDFSGVDQDVQIILKSTSTGKKIENVAILHAGFSRAPTAGDEALFELEIGNYTAKPQIVAVQVSVGDSVHTIKGTCPAKVKTTLSKKITITQSGWVTGWARLVDADDGLSADDRYPFVVQASSTPTLLLVTRQPEKQRPSSSYFLHRALAPYDNGDPGNRILVNRSVTEQFDGDVVADSQAILLDHPGLLDLPQIEPIASMIRRGRGVLYIASEAVDATNLKRIYDALGGALQAPVDFAPRSQTVSNNEQPLGKLDKDYRAFAVFGDAMNGLVSELAFAPGLMSQRTLGSLEDDVLAELSDRTVLLMKTKVGAGTFCVLNCDLENASFTRHPAFVPIVNELVDDLLQPTTRKQPALCGEPLTRLLPVAVKSTEGLKVVSSLPSFSRTSQTSDELADDGLDASSEGMELGSVFEQSGTEVVWKWKKLIGPSTFRVVQQQETVFALASHLAAEESDLRTLGADVMVDRLAANRNVVFSAVNQDASERDDGWIWFTVAAFLAIVCETIVLQLSKM